MADSSIKLECIENTSGGRRLPAIFLMHSAFLTYLSPVAISFVPIAVCVYNDGAGRLKDILEAMDISDGDLTVQFLSDKDSTRIMCSRRRARMSTKEFRRAQRLRRMGREEELAALERVPYQTGGY